MFQRVTLIGNLGGEPESRDLPSGTIVCNFSLATNERWTDQQQQVQERTTWWRVSAWGRLGEVCQMHLHKGRRVFVEGTINVDPETGGPRIWTDQQGMPRASLELRAVTVKFLDGRGNDNGESEGFDEAYSPPPTPAPARQAPAPARQQAAPARQPASQAAPARQPQAAPAGPGRRSTTPARQAPPPPDDDGFGPDEIPF
jgi:single-strand DNA-binding protein